MKNQPVLVINCGSSSVKVGAYDMVDQELLFDARVERIGEATAVMSTRASDGRTESGQVIGKVDHRAALTHIFQAVQAWLSATNMSRPWGIAHRVVHGGEQYIGPTRITQQVIADIRTLVPLAPLHNPVNLEGIEAALQNFADVPQVAVFDTAFHQTMPAYAFRYALPEEMYRDWHVRRYGFHGTSHQDCVRRTANHLGCSAKELNLITLHLGNGASVAAVRNGECVDTSMGFTPLEGLMMGTRSGDLDPAIIFYLQRVVGMTDDAIEELLNERSGLQGVGGSNDMRQLHQLIDGGDQRAKLSFDMFCYRAKKYIGAYAAVLGKVDAVIFTGGIGEHDALARADICAGLEWLGITLDLQRNGKVTGDLSEIQDSRSRVKVLVIAANEELAMARMMVDYLGRATEV